MTVLVVADTHLTDRPSDEYRWGLLPWLRDRAREHNAQEIIHCGDLTDAKDHHSAKLVNRLFDSLGNLAVETKFILLRGNHDGLDPKTPFFRFLDGHRAITYFIEPAIHDLSIGKATFVPSGTDWQKYRLHQFPYTFAHATFDGSEAENGRLLPGIKPALLEGYTGRVYSGDIHVPQRIGQIIEYVGAPYHIRFGDTFEPRVLLIHDDGTTESLTFPAPRKHVLAVRNLDELEACKAAPGDQVKVRWFLPRSEYHRWKLYQEGSREYGDERGWTVAGLELLPLEMQSEADPAMVAAPAGMTPEELIEEYAKRHGMTDYIEMGKELLR